MGQSKIENFNLKDGTYIRYRVTGNGPPLLLLHTFRNRLEYSDLLAQELINETRVDLIKIDVEGGEFAVLKGSEKIINKFHPVFIFEHGLGASDFYGTNSDKIFDFFDSLEYNIFTLKGFINQSPALSKEKLKDLYNRNKEYYFLSMFRV